MVLVVGYTAKNAMPQNTKDSVTLTNAGQKSRYIFGQNFTGLVYLDRCHSLLTVFVPGSI